MEEAGEGILHTVGMYYVHTHEYGEGRRFSHGQRKTSDV